MIFRALPISVLLLFSVVSTPGMGKDCIETLQEMVADPEILQDNPNGALRALGELLEHPEVSRFSALVTSAAQLLMKAFPSQTARRVSRASLSSAQKVALAKEYLINFPRLGYLSKRDLILLRRLKLSTDDHLELIEWVMERDEYRTGLLSSSTFPDGALAFGPGYAHLPVYLHAVRLEPEGVAHILAKLVADSYDKGEKGSLLQIGELFEGVLPYVRGLADKDRTRLHESLLMNLPKDDTRIVRDLLSRWSFSAEEVRRVLMHSWEGDFSYELIGFLRAKNALPDSLVFELFEKFDHDGDVVSAVPLTLRRMDPEARVAFFMKSRSSVTYLTIRYYVSDDIEQINYIRFGLSEAEVVRIFDHHLRRSVTPIDRYHAIEWLQREGKLEVESLREYLRHFQPGKESDKLVTEMSPLLLLPKSELIDWLGKKASNDTTVFKKAAGLSDEEVDGIRLEHAKRGQSYRAFVRKKHEETGQFLKRLLEEKKLSPEDLNEVISSADASLLSKIIGIDELFNHGSREAWEAAAHRNWDFNNGPPPQGRFTPTETLSMAVSWLGRIRDSGGKVPEGINKLLEHADHFPSQQAIETLLFYVAPQKYFERAGIEIAHELPLVEYRAQVERLEGEGKIPKGLARMAFEHAGSSDVTQALMRGALFFSHRMGRLPTDSLELISDISGIAVESLRQPRLLDSSRSLGQFFGIVLETAETLRGTLFPRGLTLDPKIYTEGNFSKWLGTLDLMRNLLFIEKEVHSGRTPKQIWEGLLKKVKMPETLSPTNLGELHTRAKTQLEQTLGRLLDRHMRQISIDELQKLEDRWGDLMPIYTLMGRFSRDKSWAGELPELGRVFDAVLRDKFGDLKFRGYGGQEEAAEEQLRVLSAPEQRQAWEAGGSRVELFTPGEKALSGEEMERQLKTRLADHVSTNLAGNLRVHKLPEVAPDLRARIVKELEAKRSPQETLEVLRTSVLRDIPAEARDASIVAGVRDWFLSNQDPLAAANMANRLLRLHNSAPDFGVRFSEDNKRDLQQILDLPKQGEKQLDQERILVTAITSDPKLLLTVGDLVTDNSCQNYRTGSHIETLLGYVVDANIQAVYSTSFGAKEFQSQADFSRVREATVAGREIRAEIVGKDKSAILSWVEADGTEIRIQTRGQERGGRRHILRLGTTPEGEPGLFLERAYITPNATLQPHYERMALETMWNLAHRMGAKTGISITLPESRNFGGAYTDAGGGAKKGPITIPANSSQKVPADFRVAPVLSP